MPAGAAHLPQALVRLVPVLLHVGEQLTLDRPGPVVGAQAARPGDVEAVHHLAVDVELELVDRAVADAHRPGGLVAVEPAEFELGQAALAGHAVHDLEVLGAAGDRAQQPRAPVARLLDVARADQRVERHRGVAQPAEAVVPVAHAAEIFRQRRGGGGDDAAGGGVGQRLQRDQRADHGLAVRALVGALGHPLVPHGLGLGELLLGRDLARHRLVRGMPGEHERQPLARLDGERGPVRVVAAAQRHGECSHTESGPPTACR